MSALESDRAVLQKQSHPILPRVAFVVTNSREYISYTFVIFVGILERSWPRT
jgi:hypothetical protein